MSPNLGLQRDEFYTTSFFDKIFHKCTIVVIECRVAMLWWTAELWIQGGDIIGLTLAVSPHTWCPPAAPRRDQEMYELFRHIKLSANCCNHTPPASIEVCRGETRSWSCYL